MILERIFIKLVNLVKRKSKYVFITREKHNSLRRLLNFSLKANLNLYHKLNDKDKEISDLNKTISDLDNKIKLLLYNKSSLDFKIIDTEDRRNKQVYYLHIFLTNTFTRISSKDAAKIIRNELNYHRSKIIKMSYSEFNSYRLKIKKGE